MYWFQNDVLQCLLIMFENTLSSSKNTYSGLLQMEYNFDK